MERFVDKTRVLHRRIIDCHCFLNTHCIALSVHGAHFDQVAAHVPIRNSGQHHRFPIGQPFLPLHHHGFLRPSERIVLIGMLVLREAFLELFGGEHVAVRLFPQPVAQRRKRRPQPRDAHIHRHVEHVAVEVLHAHHQAVRGGTVDTIADVQCDVNTPIAYGNAGTSALCFAVHVGDAGLY